MHHLSEMISKHPHVRGNINEVLVRCCEEVAACAQTCIACADACLGEQMIQDLTQCIRLDLDCADICAATAAVASRRTGSNEAVLRQMLETCASACGTCAAECERHARRHEHCRIGAETCLRCEQACREAARSKCHRCSIPGIDFSAAKAAGRPREPEVAFIFPTCVSR